MIHSGKCLTWAKPSFWLPTAPCIFICVTKLFFWDAEGTSVFMDHQRNCSTFSAQRNSLTYILRPIRNLIIGKRNLEKQTVLKFRYLKMGKEQIKKGKERKKTSGLRQLLILCRRYFKLMINDRQRMLLLIMQAPLLALLLSLIVKDDSDWYKSYMFTKSILFALSCSAFG